MNIKFELDDLLAEARRTTVGNVSDYDSLCEFDFHRNLVKYINPQASITPQYPCPCNGKQYRLDFMVKRGEKTIGLECDGEEFHDWERDVIRDNAILGNGYVDEIIRIAAKDIYYNCDTVLFLISRTHPDLFSDRGTVNLAQLVHPAFADLKYTNEDGLIWVAVPDFDKPELRSHIQLWRHMKSNRPLRAVVPKWKAVTA